MAADLSLLTPEFSEKVQQLLDNCMAAGVEMRPYFTVRSPFDQAKLWRQSRSSEEIRGKIADLRANGAPFLAQCIESVGPQHGAQVTNSIPGLSWHQWGEAVDCFWVINGAAEWSTTKLRDGINGYRVYADQAVALGLTPGGYWTSLKDWPHVQLQKASSPKSVYSLQFIDQEMQKRFG